MSTSRRDVEFEGIFERAWKCGLAAGHTATPTAVCWAGGDTQSSEVSEGVCGYASVCIRPGTGTFARWLVRTGRGNRHCYGGVEIPINEHGQSYDRKMAHASAVAQVLRNNLDLAVIVEGRTD